MSFLSVYGHIPGYLHRWKMFGFGRLMVRVHHILDIDETPFLHSHPFSYVSIVFKGGYTERLQLKDGSLKVIKRRIGSVAFRSAKQFHRIESIHGNACKTLFFSWKFKSGGLGWSLFRHPEAIASDRYRDALDGLYEFKDGFRKRLNGVWFQKKNTRHEAQSCALISIHQLLKDETFSIVE